MSLLSRARKFLREAFEDARIQSAVIGVVLSLSFLLPSSGIPGRVCAYKALTGVECPACGLTRSFIAVSHGRWGIAIRSNPAGPLVYLFSWLLLINRVGAAGGRRVLLIAERRGVYLLLWVALLVQWIARHL